jgi:hypothetical protein
MNNVFDLLSNTDYDVQQLVGEKVKELRELRQQERAKKVFTDEVLDELDDLQQFYIGNKALHNDDDGGYLASFITFLKCMDHYEGGGTTEDYFENCDYNYSLDTGDRWGEPRRRWINGQYEGISVFKGYYAIREEINRFLFQ